MLLRSVFVFIILCTGFPSFAQLTHAIRGHVVDNVLNEPIAFASIVLLNTTPVLGSITDSLGRFMVGSVPVGRYDIHVSCAGYEPALVPEVMVGAVRDIVLTVRLKQRITQLDEIVVTPNNSKQHPMNPTATVSATTLSVEEARRYAGGFDDPARLVSAFAGVAGNVGNNAVVVRGNSPRALQWKLEGIEIPNPNHLADMRAFGGGTITALSAQLLANSDFFSGAMPAAYSNALSGVFDMTMRKGNSQKREHTLQLGVVGIDVASEGPFKQGAGASYLFNYRYSTLALVGPLLADNAGGIKYQDLSFKLHFPTSTLGTFSVWGLGLIDGVGANAKRDVDQWTYDDDRENHQINQYMGVVGLSHSVYLNRKQYVTSTLATTINGIDYPIVRLDSNLNMNPKSLLNNNYRNVVLTAALHTKLNARHSNVTGFTLTNMHYDLLLRNESRSSNTRTYVTNEVGNSSLMAAYTNSTLNLGARTTVNGGVSAQHFTLNNHLAIEPRLGIKRRISGKQTLGFAYGLHSRLERLHYYFIKNNAGEAVNESLKPTKAHHIVLGYDISTAEYTRLRIETYYQHLFDVPVIADSTFSMLNLQHDWFLNAVLANDGKGKNYGVDVTFEKYLSKGSYFLLTASLFRSLYQGGDGLWRNTRYNRGFGLNMLAGKEWFVGNGKQNVISANVRISYQGGDRYSPLNIPLSAARQAAVYDETHAFSLQYPAALTNHLNLSYKMNKSRASHEMALGIINLTQYEEYVGFRYNYQTKRIDVHQEPVVVPNLSYRIDF